MYVFKYYPVFKHFFNKFTYNLRTIYSALTLYKCQYSFGILFPSFAFMDVVNLVLLHFNDSYFRTGMKGDPEPHPDGCQGASGLQTPPAFLTAGIARKEGDN